MSTKKYLSRYEKHLKRKRKEEKEEKVEPKVRATQQV